MPLYYTRDGALTIMIDDAADLNTVIYDSATMAVLFNRQAWEVTKHGPAPPPPPPVRPPDPAPDPVRPPVGVARVIPVTDASDGPLVNRGYSYWPSAFVNRGGASVVLFAGHEDGHPRFFEVDLRSGGVSRLGALLPYTGTSEGWAFDHEGWVYLCDGSAYRRVNPFTGEQRLVFDISAPHPDCVLWQPHSSASGRTHSATVLKRGGDGPWEKLGTVVLTDSQQIFFPRQGELDESALVGDGWVVIKENLGAGDRNRCIHLQTRETRFIEDIGRALGHSDCSDTLMVGEADKPDPGGLGVWDLTQPLTPERFRLLVPTLNMGYVSVRAGKCLWSGDEWLCLVDLADGHVQPLVQHGGGSAYDDRVKASLSPCGRVATYMANNSVYLLVLP